MSCAVLPVCQRPEKWPRRGTAPLWCGRPADDRPHHGQEIPCCAKPLAGEGWNDRYFLVNSSRVTSPEWGTVTRSVVVERSS
jgi:hypothetical protein